MGAAHSSRVRQQPCVKLYWPELPESPNMSQPSSCSSASGHPFRGLNSDGKRKYLTTLIKGKLGLQDNGHQDIDASQAANVIDDILELIFRMLLEGSRSVAEDASRLAVASRVNRHWNHVANRMLYRTVEVTGHIQLHHLIKTLNRSHAKRSLVCHLKIPNMVPFDPALGTLRDYPVDTWQRHKGRAQAQTNELVMHLLSLPTKLSSLDIHGDAVQLWPEGSDEVVPTGPLINLVTVTSLTLRGKHDGRWKFLLKYAPDLTRFTASPDWTVADDPYLPFDSYNLHSLALMYSEKLSSEYFMKLLRVPKPRLSRVIFCSNIRHLELVDVPSILSSPRLEYFLGLLSSTIETLRITSSSRRETEHITEVLTSTLPTLSTLTHLSTSAHSLAVFSPSLHSLTITLGAIGNPSPGWRPSGPSDSSAVGMIYHTIVNILDAVPETPLKTLTIIDAAVEDYLYFNLTGSRGFGNDEAFTKQDRLWRRASHQGVLITVVNPAKDTNLFERRQVGALFEPPTSIGEPDLTRIFPHLG